MGNIQNSINQGIATIGTAMALGEHLAEQKKQNKVAKIEAEQEVFNAENALKANTENVMQTAVEQELEGNYTSPEQNANETPAEYEDRIVQDYLDNKSELAEDKYQNAMMSVKHPAESKRVQAARIAANEAQDEINARKNLKFDLEKAKAKFKALGGRE